jgi:hypothetical protein
MAAVISCVLMAMLVACSSAPARLTSTQPQVQPIQVPIPETAAEVPGPVSGTAMTKEYVQMLTRTAYFWPVVATSGRCAAFAKAPERLYLGGVLRGHSRKRAAAASQGFLVDDALQRSPPVQPQPTQDLLARDKEQDSAIQAGRLAHDLCGRDALRQVDARRPSVVQLTTPRSVGLSTRSGLFSPRTVPVHLQTFRDERLIGL